MRVESLSSRLDFSERRVRALEGVVQYRPEAMRPRERREPLPEVAAGAATEGVVADGSEGAIEPQTGAVRSDAEGSARRRRRRRRGRRGNREGITAGAGSEPNAPDQHADEGGSDAADVSSFDDAGDGGDTPSSPDEQ
jgi:ribonuclease E